MRQSVSVFEHWSKEVPPPQKTWQLSVRSTPS